MRALLALVICLVVLRGGDAARAQPPSPDELLNQIGFEQKLNQLVPLDLMFRDERGRTVRLGEYFATRPVILTLNYYECPNLCTLLLTKLVETMRGLAFDAGNQYVVVTVSIDPRETPELAAAKKATYLERYGRAGAADGWHFLTGEQAAIARLAEAVGFRYAYDPRQDQYAHPSGIVVLTPQGRIARYFYDLEYTPGDLRLGLVEASEGRIGSPVDQFWLRCYHYDPATGKYTLAIINIARAAGVATAAILGMLVLTWLRRERRTVLRIEQRG